MLVLVAGVPRSGTSLTAEILRRLGVYVGSDFEPPSDAAKYGLCEDRVFRGLQNALINKETYTLRDHQSLWDRHDDLLKERDEKYKHHGLKSWQLIFHSERIASMIHDVRLVNTRRPLEHSIASLEAVTGIANADHIWQCYKGLSKLITNWKLPRLEVPWDSIHAEPDAWVGKLAEFVCLPVTEEALKVHDPEWRRYG